MALNRSHELYLLKAGQLPGDDLGPGHFSPQGHNLNKLGRGPLGDAIHTNYQDSRPGKKLFSCFHYM